MYRYITKLVPFQDLTVKQFDLKAMHVHDKLDTDPDSMDWKGVIKEMKKKYSSLESQGMWKPAENIKKNRDNEIAALTGKLINLVQKEQVPSHPNKPKNQKKQDNNNNEVTCYNCGEQDHIKPNCPKL